MADNTTQGGGALLHSRQMSRKTFLLYLFGFCVLPLLLVQFLGYQKVRGEARSAIRYVMLNVLDLYREDLDEKMVGLLEVTARLAGDAPVAAALQGQVVSASDMDSVVSLARIVGVRGLRLVSSKGVRVLIQDEAADTLGGAGEVIEMPVKQQRAYVKSARWVGGKLAITIACDVLEPRSAGPGPIGLIEMDFNLDLKKSVPASAVLTGIADIGVFVEDTDHKLRKLIPAQSMGFQAERPFLSGTSLNPENMEFGQDARWGTTSATEQGMDYYAMWGRIADQNVWVVGAVDADKIDTPSDIWAIVGLVVILMLGGGGGALLMRVQGAEISRFEGVFSMMMMKMAGADGKGQAPQTLEEAMRQIVASYTEQKDKLEFALIEREGKLAALEKGLDDAEKRAATGGVINDIAHDVKQPLQMLQMILDTGHDEDSEEFAITLNQRDATKAFRAITEISNLLNDVQSAAVHDAGQARVMVSMKTIMDSVLTVVGPKLEKRGVQFKQMGDADTMMFCDEKSIGRVLINLVGNAAEAMAEKPPAEARKVTVRWKATADGVRVDVTDNGPGIAPERLENLLRAGRSTKAGGWGRGLRIVQQLIEQHQGQVRVESRVGYGTNFYFEVPNR